MIRMLFTGFIAAIVTFGLAGAEPSPARSDDAQPVVAAMFYSGFCASCRVLEPRIEAVRDDYADQPVTFIRFDKTWSALGGGDRRAALAQDHGMAEIWERHKGGQGFMLLVDPGAQEVLAMVTIRHSERDIRALLDAALARSS